MKIDLQPVSIASRQHVSMRLPELVPGVTGVVHVIADDDALPGASALVKMTLDIEVLPHTEEQRS